VAPEDSATDRGLTVHLDSIVPPRPIAGGSRPGSEMKTAATTIARGNAIVPVRRRSPSPRATVVLPQGKGLMANIVHPPGTVQIAAAPDVHAVAPDVHPVAPDVRQVALGVRQVAAGDSARVRKAAGHQAVAEEGM